MKLQALETAKDELLNEILTGLRGKYKKLPPKLFYDEKGSHLFEEICRTKEYYLTRTELEIMEQNINEISLKLGEGVLLIEPGSGSSKKTMLLLKSLNRPAGYIPIDISSDYLHASTGKLKKQLPRLNVYPIAADFTKPFKLPEPEITYSRRIIFYPGSTIGNFNPGEARYFLMRLFDLAGNRGGLLVGIDLIKNSSIIEAAYNDHEGITAKFNLNILDHINNEFDGNFNTEGFRHLAFFNNAKNRIEMYLVSTEKQQVSISDQTIYFERGETILTEYSYKYSFDMINDLTKDIFTIQKFWTDKDMYFGLFYLEPV